LISGLWAFLRGLFRRTPPTAPIAPTAPEQPPQAAPEASPPEASPSETSAEAPPEPAQPAPQPVDAAVLQASNDDLEEDEDWGGDEEDGVVDDAEPDPFITGATLPDGPASADVEALRAEARAEALLGEHRVYLSSPAGPGSLAEALNLLLGEGAVEAQFVDEAEEGPYILYRPVS
jgi:hypothetical protein